MNFVIVGYIIICRQWVKWADGSLDWSSWHQHWNKKVYESREIAEDAVAQMKQCDFGVNVEYEAKPVYQPDQMSMKWQK